MAGDACRVKSKSTRMRPRSREMTTAGAAIASLRWGSQAVARTPSGFVQEAWAEGPFGLGWSMPPTLARVSPHTPGHAIHARLVVRDDLQRRARRVALAVGEVVPRLGLMEAGLEVGGVRAAGDVDHRPVGIPGDLGHLRPRALLGLAVLGVDGEIGRAVVDAQLDHLPVALVQADPERQVVVVVEVEEPVLKPQVAVGLDGVAVHAVAQIGTGGAQRDVLRAVVLAGVADAVAVAHLLAVGVVRRPEVVQGQRRAAGQQVAEGVRTVGAAQLVARVAGPFRGAVAEILLHGVVLQAGLMAVQEIVVLTHGHTVRSGDGPPPALCYG